jgi:hypothetical protein
MKKRPSSGWTFVPAKKSFVTDAPDNDAVLSSNVN